MIRDFAKHIVSIDASVNGHPVSLNKLDKHTWMTAPVHGPLEVSYQVYAWDLSVRGAHLDTTHGFFNGTSVFLRVVGQENEAVGVSLTPPPEEAATNWRLATTLLPVDVDDAGFGDYRARDYEHLIDCPVEMGDFQSLDFDVQSVPHRMVLTGKCYPDRTRIAADLQKICDHHATMFTELPLEQYLFLVMVTGDGYGGLEHRDSTALMCKRLDLPGCNMKTPSDDYIGFMGLCSHEYFHLWNVKRIRPQRFKDADLTAEVHTELLWAFEGITSYYDDLALVRTGCINPDAYLKLLARTITRVMRSSGRFKQSVAESSFDAWTRFYQQDENAPNAIISYYSKGALIAFGLDMILRDSTADQRCLDDLMRRLWSDFGKPDIGVSEQDVEHTASKVAGQDLTSFFDVAVRGTDELPLETWFASLGIGYRLRPANTQDDWGSVGETAATDTAQVSLGVRYAQKGEFIELLQVFKNGSAQRAGLSAGDKLLAIDGIQATEKNIDLVLDNFVPGTQVPVHVFRRDELMSFTLTLQPSPRDTCDLWFMQEEQCTAQQLARRRLWLNQT